MYMVVFMRGMRLRASLCRWWSRGRMEAYMVSHTDTCKSLAPGYPKKSRVYETEALRTNTGHVGSPLKQKTI